MLALTNRLRSSIVAALLGSMLFVLPAPAQCVPDGLGFAPCCGPASVTLPAFPPISQAIQFFCFDSCQPAFAVNYCVDIGTPNPVLVSGTPVCGAYHIRFK